MTSTTNDGWLRKTTIFEHDLPTRGSREVETIWRADLIDAPKQEARSNRPYQWQPERIHITRTEYTSHGGDQVSTRVRVYGHRIKVNGDLSKVEAEDYWYYVDSREYTSVGMPSWVRGIVLALSDLSFPRAVTS